MTPLESLHLKHTEASLVLDKLEAAHNRKLLADGSDSIAAVRKLSRARAEVRRLEAMVRAGRVDQVEEISDSRLTG